MKVYIQDGTLGQYALAQMGKRQIPSKDKDYPSFVLREPDIELSKQAWSQAVKSTLEDENVYSIDELSKADYIILIKTYQEYLTKLGGKSSFNPFRSPRLPAE